MEPRRLALDLLFVAVLIVILLVAYALFSRAPSPASPPSGLTSHPPPSLFGPAVPQSVSPGSKGCAATPDEVCFAIGIRAYPLGFPVGNISIEILNSSFDSLAVLPQTAALTLFNATNVTVAAWNLGTESWETGASATLEGGYFVFDSGSTGDLVSGDYFETAAHGVGSGYCRLP